MINCVDYKINKEINNNLFVTATMYIDSYAQNFASEIENFNTIAGFPTEALNASPKYDCGSTLYDVATGDVYMNNGSSNTTGWVKQ